MPPPALLNINVKLDDDGHMSLNNPHQHGCVVFDPANWKHFELEFTAQQDDPWKHKGGAYCMGIMPHIAIELIRASIISDTKTHHVRQAWQMAQGCRIWSLCTGAMLFHDSVFLGGSSENRTQIFESHLKKDQSLIMHFRQGKLGYRLGEQALVDTTNIIKRDPKHDIISSCHHSLRHHQHHITGHRVAPCIWIFAQQVPDEHKLDEVERDSYKHLTGKVELRSWNHSSCMHLLNQPSNKRWKSMFVDKHFTDCKIKFSGKLIAAHRAVICQASPVLYAAFHGPWQEGQEAVYNVKMPDQSHEDVEIMRAIIEFMYTEKLQDFTMETLIAMLPLAVYFQLDELCTTLASLLIDNLDAENAKDVKDVARVINEFSCCNSLTWAKADLLQHLKSNKHLLDQVLS